MDFQEEHSHATEQRLYCSSPYREQLLNAEVIIFVEDEVTTGKTIWNFVQALRKAEVISEQVRFAIASLVNGLTDDLLQDFYPARHLLPLSDPRLLPCPSWDPLSSFAGCRAVATAEPPADFTPALWEIGGKLESRSGVENLAYHQAALALGAELLERLAQNYGQLSGRILVLGSEEFMYPAILAADQLQKCWPDSEVVVHATTRSPIKISREAGYPIDNGCQLTSLYAAGRQTFVYDLRPYDWAIWLTDADDLQLKGAWELEQALRQAGCQHILGVRWCK